MKIFGWIINTILFVLLLVLILDNIQKVTINFYGIYTITIPLIVALVVFTLFGALFSYLICLAGRIKLKSQIKLLQKQLNQQQLKKDPTDQII